MPDYKVTRKRSFLGSVYCRLIKLFRLKKMLASDSYKQLQAYEDTLTPVRKGYVKEVMGGVCSYWINKEKSENGILVYLPGGGFIIGPVTLHWIYCEKLSKKLDMAVLVIRYDLAPEQPFPKGLNDIVSVIVNLQNRGILKQDWFLGGDSSGGNLAMAACYQLNALKAALPKKLMLLFPSVDMNPGHGIDEVQKIIPKDVLLSLEFTAKVLSAYASNQDLDNPLLSPLNGAVEILPPVLLQHGTNDILIPASRELVKKMEAAGKPVQYEEYEGMFHGFVIVPGLPEAKKAIRSQINFIKN